MTVKILITTAVALTVAAPLVEVADPAVAAAQPAVFAAALPARPPQAPVSTLPTAQELTSILDNLTDPEVPDEVKSGLVVGGLQPHQANVLDRKLRRADRRSGRPFEFAVTNIQPQGGPDTVSTEVTAAGSGLAAPITKTATFSYQNGGWMLSQGAADELIEDVVGRLPG